MACKPLIDELFTLDGRVALITGGSKGLGETFAQTLAAAGASVAICSRNGDEAAATAKRIASDENATVIGLQADVSDESAVSSMFADVSEQLGPVDILVANAGINLRKDTTEWSAEEWNAVIGTNLTGCFLAAKEAIPSMREKGWGRIVFLSSMLAFVSLPGRPAYTASKAGLLGLTRTLALENAVHGICVNAVCPGPFKTPMNVALSENPELNKEFIEKLPVGRWGEPDELRGLMLYLCSNACSFMTGSSLVIDGGWTAQ